MSISREVIYFQRPGFLNTNSVVQAVKKRVTLGDVEAVVVPFTTGRTAERFFSELKDIKVETITENEAMFACKRVADSDQGLLGKLVRGRLDKASKMDDMKSRRELFDMTFLPFCGETWNAIRETLYAFGQGMKVAIELSVAAVEVGKVKPFTKVIVVGGTGEGADTAIVVRTSSQREAFGKKSAKRLLIQEIIAMPIEKW